MSLRCEYSNGRYALCLDADTLLVHERRRPLLAVGTGRPRVTSRHGNYSVRDSLTDAMTPLRNVEVLSSPEDTVVLRCADETGTRSALLECSLQPGAGGTTFLSVSIKAAGDVNRVTLFVDLDRREGVFGGGEQFSRLDLRGSRLPLLSEEQGVGRAKNLVTLAADIHSGAGGRWYSTYFPQPSFVTTGGTWVLGHNGCYAVFDFRGGLPRRMRSSRYRAGLLFWTGEVQVDLGRSPGGVAGAVSALSERLGRQPRLADWVDQGLILGLQGGSDVVRRKLAVADEAGITTTGVWAQDWEGRRVTSFGSQLFWNWEYDAHLYPDMPRLLEELHGSGKRFLGYINPFLATDGAQYAEAADKGYLVRDPSGEPYRIVVTTFPSGLVDLTNPEAVAWIKSVIKRNMIDLGLDGWMADFGEYLPADAMLYDGTPAMDFHNRYPAQWARANYEAVAEAGKLDEIVFFTRAGFTGSSRYVPATWAGDQMVDWSRHDGLPSVLPAALSLGMSGVGVHHSDIGGYTTLFWKRRSRELFQRWAEQAAFSMIMRNHEGNRPGSNWQWDGDAATLSHLRRMVDVFVALRPYRRSVLDEYYTTGIPPLRPLVFHDDARRPARRAQTRSYLYGSDLFVAPVLSRGQRLLRVDLPGDDWIHLWSGTATAGGRHRVHTPLGFPAVFYRRAGEFAELFSEITGRFGEP